MVNLARLAVGFNKRIDEWLKMAIWDNKFHAKYGDKQTNAYVSRVAREREMRERERMERREAKRQELLNRFNRFSDNVDEMADPENPEQPQNVYEPKKGLLSRLVSYAIASAKHETPFYQQFDTVSPAITFDKYDMPHSINGVRLDKNTNLDEFFVQQDMSAPKFGRLHKDWPNDMPDFGKNSRPTSGPVFKDLSKNDKGTNIQRVKISSVQKYNEETKEFDDVSITAKQLKSSHVSIIKNDEPRGMAYTGEDGSYANIEGYTSDSIKQIADFYNGTSANRDLTKNVQYDAFKSPDGKETLYVLDLSKLDPNSKGLLFSDGKGGLSYAYDSTGDLKNGIYNKDPEMLASVFKYSDSSNHFDDETNTFTADMMNDSIGMMRNLNRSTNDLDSDANQATMIADLLLAESRNRQIEEAKNAGKTIVTVDTYYQEDELDNTLTKTIERVAEKQINKSKDELSLYPEFVYQEPVYQEEPKEKETKEKETKEPDVEPVVDDEPQVFEGDFKEVVDEEVKESNAPDVDDDTKNNVEPDTDNTEVLEPETNNEADYVDPIIPDEPEEFIPDENIEPEQIIDDAEISDVSFDDSIIEDFDATKYATYEEYVNDFDYDYSDRELEAKAILDSRMNNQPDPEPFEKPIVDNEKIDTPDNVIQLGHDEAITDLSFTNEDANGLKYNIKDVDSDSLIVCEVYNEKDNKLSYFPMNKNDVYPDMDMEKMHQAALARDDYMDCISSNASQTVHSVPFDLIKQNPEFSDVLSKVVASNYEFTNDSIANERAERARIRERAADALDKSNKQFSNNSKDNQPDLSMVD